ncbi:hypothetical protein [Arthrobacter sp.]|uniref:hypothetical protein n=1 Tax=Arthrobacter sp. TaxID=1667 RepID=UPI0028A12E6E|nr:hypothetical protein [Arthrobacter sp.]
MFSASEANDFRALTREVFAEMGFEVEMHPDHAVDSEGRKFGFWNISAICSGLPRTEWRTAIGEHLKNVLAGFTQDPFSALTLEEAAKQTYSRLYEESALPSLEGYPHREFAPGIVEMLALDLPESVAMFDHQNAQRFGGSEALRNQGIANLQSLDVERLETIPASGATFSCLSGNSFYTGSRAVLLPGLATQVTGKRVHEELGWLLCVPNRHQVAWHIIEDASIVGAVQGMAGFGVEAFSSVPGPVSPHVYWWNGSGYEQLTHRKDDGTLVVRVSPNFQRVIEAVTAATPGS